MHSPFNGLLWLLLLLGPLMFLQRGLHREIQAVFLILTRRVDLSVALFSLIFFPGVFLHEVSHFLMAKILGVPTGKVSFMPHSIEGNRLRLGYVETGKTDLLRDALIGTAPLLIGGAFVAYVGVVRLGLLAVWEAFARTDWPAMLDALMTSFSSPDFWLWFYLMVTISSTMFPSPSDRRAWIPLALIIALIIFAALLFGAGPWMSEHLLPVLNDGLQGVTIVFAISAGVHLLVLIPIWVLRKGLGQAMGLKVVRG